MCGRTASALSRDELAQLLAVDEVAAPELPVTWNVAPTQPVYAVASATGGRRKLRSLSWGLVPHWAKDLKMGSRLINARAETVYDRPAYRSLIGSQRALLAFSGFYEWRRARPGEPGAKQPFYFYRPDGQPLVLAGLWDIWHDTDGSTVRTCTIITTKANATLAPVHDRMPVILPPDCWDQWLARGPLPRQRVAQLLSPAPDDLLHGYPVRPAVNNAANDGPQLIEPI